MYMAEAQDFLSADYSEAWSYMTLTGANGDVLYLDYAMAFNGTEWVGTYDISGGTGRLTDASGAGDLVAIINYTRPPTWTFDGRISF